MTEQYFSRGVSFRRGWFVCVLTRALISSFIIIFNRTFKRYIYIYICLFVCVCISIYLYLYAILRVRGENAAFTLSLHVCMWCMCLRVSLRSLDVRIGRRQRRRTLLSHIHYQLQKNIKEMRISLSPIDRRWKENRALGRHLAILARINWSLILCIVLLSWDIMVIKDERTSIARVSNEWKSDASMHTPTPTPTHSFALDRCYSYYMCYNFVFYFHRDNRVRKRDNSNIIKQRYEALRERQNAYASFSWAAFKFYECLPRSLEARANVIVGVRSPTDCRSWSSRYPLD